MINVDNMNVSNMSMKISYVEGSISLSRFLLRKFSVSAILLTIITIYNNPFPHLHNRILTKSPFDYDVSKQALSGPLLLLS